MTSLQTALLLGGLWPLGLGAQQPTPAGRAYTVVRNNRLLESMTTELRPKPLRAVYGKDFRVGKISPNTSEPTVPDTVLVVNTGGDKLSLFTNQYNSFLLSADLTSPRLTFGRGVRVGISKAAFCKAYGLSPRFTTYHVVSTPESHADIGFVFRQEKLVRVVYQITYID